MKDIFVSNSRFGDAAGQYDEVLKKSGDLAYSKDVRKVPTPAFSDSALWLDQPVDGNTVGFDVPRLKSAHERLATLGGLRVQVDMQSRDGQIVTMPGIVLPSDADVPMIGFLAHSDKIEEGDKHLPLSDTQQVLLRAMAAKHMPGVGQHAAPEQAQNGRGLEARNSGLVTVNAGDIGHAALIAITNSDSPNGLNGMHNRVHDFVAAGLAPSIARTGSLNIGVKGDKPRNVDELVVPAARFSRITVPRNYQVPEAFFEGLGLASAGDAAVGVTLGAVQSQEAIGRPQPDLAFNAAAMVA